jgi:peroxiredoxin
MDLAWRRAMEKRTGKAAAPFSLPDGEGKTHRLEDFRGSWLLLVFHRHLG